MSVSSSLKRFMSLLLAAFVAGWEMIAFAATSPVPFPNPFEPGYFPAYHSPVVVGNVAGAEASTDTESLNFKFPLDGEISRTLMLKNTNGADVLVSFKPSMNIPGFDESAFINHPQGGMLILSPGEIFPIRLNYTTGQAYSMKAGERIDMPMSVTITVQRQENTPGESATFEWNDTLAKVSDGPPFRDPEANATIKIYVVDADGKALPGIDVMVNTGSAALNAQTDQDGASQVPVFAHQRTGTIHWRENTVTVEDRRSGIYSSTSRVVTPKAGETINLTIVMKRRASLPQVEYAQVKVLDIGYQTPYWDASDGGSVIATVPFHTGDSTENLVNNAYLNVFSSQGELLWKHPIGGETPAVDVSADGSLIATTVQLPPGPGGLHWGGVPTVFDKQGKIVMQFAMPEMKVWGTSLNDQTASVVQISQDKRYLVAGAGDGRLFFFDMSSGKSLWSAYARGQVRKIAFDGTPEQRLFVSSGDGYLRAFDPSGKLLWKTYVDAWLYDMEISENYIVTNSKGAMAALHLLEKATGRILWSYPMAERGSGIAMSPDEKLIWYGTEIGGAVTSMRNVVLNIDGLPVLDLEGARKAGLGGAFPADSPLIFAKSGTTVDVYDFSGANLWSQQVIKNRSGFSMNYLIWVSEDASRFAVSLNDRTDGDMYGQVYFYQSCTYSLSATSQSVTANAYTGMLNVTTTPSGCAWTASSDVAWITFLSGNSGSGNGTVTYAVAANPSTSTRVGTLTIAGRAFTVTQAESHAVVHQVTVSGLSFSPQTVTINAGDTVTWTGLQGHSTTSGANCQPDGKWDSGLSAATFSKIFNDPGIYPYYCIPHCGSGMTGTVVVNAVDYKGDINNDGPLNLQDAILALQLMTGSTPTGNYSAYLTSGADVDGNNKMGLAEAIYILQKIGELR